MNPASEDSHSIALPKGTVIGTYTIEYLLGSGGFGLTYCASNRLGQKVAIKELLPDGMAIRVNSTTVYPKTDRFAADFKWAVERFEGEARTLAGLDHPHIVKVNDLIEANNTAYMVMEYIEGESLADAVRRLNRQGARYSEKAVWVIFDALLNAADYIHQHQLIHRDIKPANILLKGSREGSEGGPAVLIDFGSARQDIGQSVSMTSVVSRGFSSFEQYNSRGKSQGPWSDIYSLAATIYFVCTGGESPPEAIERFEAPEKPGWVKQVLGDAYSDRLLLMLETGMAVRAADRPRNIREWKEATATPSQSAQTDVERPCPPIAEEKKETGDFAVKEKTPDAPTVGPMELKQKMFNGFLLMGSIWIFVSLSISQMIEDISFFALVAWGLPLFYGFCLVIAFWPKLASVMSTGQLAWRCLCFVILSRASLVLAGYLAITSSRFVAFFLTGGEVEASPIDDLITVIIAYICGGIWGALLLIAGLRTCFSIMPKSWKRLLLMLTCAGVLGSVGVLVFQRNMGLTPVGLILYGGSQTGMLFAFLWGCGDASQCRVEWWRGHKGWQVALLLSFVSILGVVGWTIAKI